MTQFHWKVLRSSNSQLQSISFPGINQNQNFSVHIKPDQQDKIRSESVCHFMQVSIWTLFSLFLSKKSHITSGFLRKVGVFYNRTALIQLQLLWYFWCLVKDPDKNCSSSRTFWVTQQNHSAESQETQLQTQSNENRINKMLLRHFSNGGGHILGKLKLKQQF